MRDFMAAICAPCTARNAFTRPDPKPSSRPGGPKSSADDVSSSNTSRADSEGSALQISAAIPETKADDSDVPLIVPEPRDSPRDDPYVGYRGVVLTIRTPGAVSAICGPRVENIARPSPV